LRKEKNLKTEIQTKTIYITEDGKKFNSEKQAKEYEIKHAKEIYKNNILNMSIEELNNEIVKVFEKEVKNYAGNISIAFELENELKIFEEGYICLSRDYSEDWSICRPEYESIYSVVTKETISEAICVYALLDKLKLI